MNMMVRPTEAVRFNETDLDVYNLGGLRWLRLAQICDSLQVVEKTAKRIFQQHKHEFAEDETGVIKVPTSGGPQMTRVFSSKGAARLAMLLKSPFGAQFRDTVLTNLAGSTNTDDDSDEIAVASDDVPSGVLFSLQQLFIAAKGNAALVRYLKLGLSTSECAKLLGVSAGTVRQKRRTAEWLGMAPVPTHLEERKARDGWKRLEEARDRAREAYNSKRRVGAAALPAPSEDDLGYDPRRPGTGADRDARLKRIQAPAANEGAEVNHG